MSEDFAARVRRRLGDPLPGLSGQLGMAHSLRRSIDPEQARLQPHKESAVLVLLMPASPGQMYDSADTATVYTARRADLRHHAGQISFPGGRREGEESLLDTALREAEEEIGIDRKAIEVLGPLTPLFIRPSRFIVHPFVATAAERPKFTLQEEEVDSIIEVELTSLLDPSNRKTEPWEIRGETSQVPYFDIRGHRIWGATAMITHELLEVLP